MRHVLGLLSLHFVVILTPDCSFGVVTSLFMGQFGWDKVRYPWKN